MKIRVGTYHEPESRELSRCPGYYAADWEKHQTVPGNYPLFVEFQGGYNIPMPYWVLVSITSKVVDGALFSGCGGVNYSCQKIKPHDSHWPVQTWCYSLKDMVAAGRVTLNDGWEFLALDTREVLEEVKGRGLTWPVLKELHDSQLGENQ